MNPPRWGLLNTSTPEQKGHWVLTEWPRRYMNDAWVLKPSLPKLTVLLIQIIWVYCRMSFNHQACTSLWTCLQCTVTWVPSGKVWFLILVLCHGLLSLCSGFETNKNSKSFSLVFAVSWDSDTGILIIYKGSKLYLYISLHVLKHFV